MFLKISFNITFYRINESEKKNVTKRVFDNVI